MDAQTLTGHTNRKMTEAYKKGHEIEWTYANAKGGLKVPNDAKQRQTAPKVRSF